MIITLFFLFIIGIFLGSFLNVIIDRLPNNKDIFFDRSECSFCHRKLRAFDLIPIFSFIFLKGKCKYCKKFIGWKYIVIESITGVLFLVAGSVLFKNSYFFNFDLIFYYKLFFYLLIASVVIIIFFTDLFYGIIPDQVLIFSFVVSLIFQILLKINIVFSLEGAFLSIIFFLLIYYLSKRKGMGLGDVKFSFLIGFILGPINAFLSFYLSFLTGGIVSFILILWHKKKLKKDTIPFGPFLAFSLIIFLFWGDILQRIILHLLGL